MIEPRSERDSIDPRQAGAGMTDKAFTPQKTIQVKISDLTTALDRALARYGYPPSEVPLIRDILMYAELRGNSQGLAKLLPPGIPRDAKAGEISMQLRAENALLINGRHNAGMVVMQRASSEAITLAKQRGFAAVATCGTSSSTGAIGYYARKIAEQGLLAICMSGTPALVAPHGTSQKLFGTNPLAIAFPHGLEPIVLDMTTSAIAYYDVLAKKERGELLQPDQAFDAQGNITLNPVEALTGAFRCFDRGPRGSGLALAIELFCGPFVSAVANRLGQPKTDWGNLILAFDSTLFSDAGYFEAGVSELIASIKGARKAEGVDEVFLPGERGEKRARAIREAGTIEIAQVIWEKIECLSL